MKHSVNLPSFPSRRVVSEENTLGLPEPSTLALNHPEDTGSTFYDEK